MAQLPSNDVKSWSDRHQGYAKIAGFKSWEVWIIEIEHSKQRIICGASTMENAPCKAAPMENGRCRKHGGKTPVGIASANWETGKHSRLFPTLPTRLLDAAARSHADPELLSLRRQISVLEARDGELYAELTTGESGAAWGQASRVLREALLVQEDEERGHEFPGLMHQLELIVADGVGDRVTWAEIHNNYEMARRLRDSEMTRLKSLQAAMDAKQVKSIIGRLLAIIKRRVIDPTTLGLIMEDVAVDFRRTSNGQQHNGVS